MPSAIKARPDICSNADCFYNMLMRLANHNEYVHDSAHYTCVFSTRGAPSITLMDYVKRIAAYSKVTPELWVICVVYLLQLKKIHQTPFNLDVLVFHKNNHRLVACLTFLAVKFHLDVPPSNAFMAQVYGISVAEMNRLEMAILNMLEWKLYVSPKNYEHALAVLRLYAS